MQENYELVQQGFRILVKSMSVFIVKELKKVYGEMWWSEVLNTLQDQRDLVDTDNDDERLSYLDIANCIRLIDRKWRDVFRAVLSKNCRSWSNELMGYRNDVSHIGQQDLDQATAERSLDTMYLLCRQIDPVRSDEIRNIYNEIRAKADGKIISYTGLEQPASESVRGELTEGSLLNHVGSIVFKTEATRKVTYDGKTQLYPVYRVPLDLLYYNDQNDRIATWISQYESENGKDSLKVLSKNDYNDVIENFILSSNSEAINKTQNNIEITGQRVPGVALADGRIVDGNRRYTCLRRIQRNSQVPMYFETVIMDMDIHADKKKIKLLELATQHGEEAKIDYDPIEYAIGTYRDVIQTGLLTDEEYARSTNERVSDVRKRIAIAKLVSEFLEYIKLPEQYHVARDYRVYDLFQEMMPSLKTLDEKGREQLKLIAFNNAMIHAVTDQRKFIRDIKNMIKNDTYASFFEEQMKLNQEIREKYESIEIRQKADVEKFAKDNESVINALQSSMENALLRSRSQQLRERPTENVAKCIELMMDVDSRQFGRMTPNEKKAFISNLDDLAKIVENFRKSLE